MPPPVVTVLRGDDQSRHQRWCLTLGHCEVFTCTRCGILVGACAGILQTAGFQTAGGAPPTVVVGAATQPSGDECDDCFFSKEIPF